MHLQCETCGASLLVDPNQRTAVCPYCASPSVVERPPSMDRPVPHFVVGFTMTREGAQGAVKEWLGKRSFFVQSSVKGGSIDSIRGVYAPAYLYSGMAQTRYAAQIGENYQETETYSTTDEKGNTVVKTRTVTRTEYRDLEGQHATYVMDVLVSASRAVPNAELEAIEPFDLRTMRRFSPAVISGWIAEEPTMTRDACYGLARGEALEKIGKELTEFMPGDSHHALTFQTVLDRESTELIYVPIWVLAIRHHPQKPPFRVLINGQSGRVYGKAPLSWIKIVLTVLAVLILIATPFVLIALQKGGSKPRGSAPSTGPVATTPAAATTPAPTTKATAPARPTATTKPPTGGAKPAPTGVKK
jgi:DNA-directed RNA polymerase subunit RPC12/RpoP